MTLRKSSLFLTAFWIWASTVQAGPSPDAPIQKGAPVPSLHYAGVIPVQWDKDEIWQDLSFVKTTLDREFPAAVKDSHRFAMVNNDLVASLWKTPAGRSELVSDYELSAFLSLDVSARGDMVILTSRILSSKLETRVQESDVIPRRWLSEATKDQTAARMTDLVSRMINRLPVDVHVTSVNGSYVTLSGGEEQSIKAGQKFDVLAATIGGLHPANGSWTSFEISKTGTIEVIELKNLSAIGRITSLTHEGSIKPGNGIRVEEISGRNRFARTDELVADDSEVSPSSQSAAPREPAVTADLTIVKPSTPTTKPETPIALTQKTVPDQESDKPTAANAKIEKAFDAPPPTDSFTAKLLPKGSELRPWVGMRMWSISGSSSAAASLPVWIINSAGADVFRNFSETIDYHYGLDLGYGPTSGGSFFGYNLHAGGRWHMYMKDLVPGADDFYVGLLTSMASTSISSETTGGFTTTMVRLSFGIHGWANPEFIGEKVEWTGEFFYPLYYSGEFGVKGQYRAITSGSSMAFKIAGYLGERPTNGWQYGAAFDYESNSWSLEKNKTAAYGSIGILALARRSL